MKRNSGNKYTLLNQLWDEYCLKSSPRRTVEVNWEENGMEVTTGELRVPTFYFMNETKFWQQIQQLFKSQIQREQCLKNIIYQKLSLNGSRNLLHHGTWKDMLHTTSNSKRGFRLKCPLIFNSMFDTVQ